jgi:hypothetical protein
MANQTRIVPIPAFANAPSNLYLKWAPKDPNVDAQYCVDASGYLNRAGRTIVGMPTITCGSDDLTISNISTGGGLTNFLVSGGQDVHT